LFGQARVSSEVRLRQTRNHHPHFQDICQVLRKKTTEREYEAIVTKEKYCLFEILKLAPLTDVELKQP